MKVFNIEVGDWSKREVNDYCRSFLEVCRNHGIKDAVICPMRYGIGHVSVDDKSILCLDINDLKYLTTDDLIILIKEEISRAQRS